jgi:ribosomal protein S18 acetylase RimI-like enzyme
VQLSPQELVFRIRKTGRLILFVMPSPNADSDVLNAKSDSSNISEPRADEGLLDNPIWNALCTEQKSLALDAGMAKRFPAAIGPLSGVAEETSAAFDSLRTIAGVGGTIVLFMQVPPAPPSNWTLVRGGILVQMICRALSESEPRSLPLGTRIRRLTTADVPDMMALAELTEPGPFRDRTIELGIFFGAFESDRLVAMAGQRMALPQFIEVSAVCTHPDARGKGYARTLMSLVMDDIRHSGKTPFLHAFADNFSAIRVYEDLGFTLRRNFHLALLKNEG